MGRSRHRLRHNSKARDAKDHKSGKVIEHKSPKVDVNLDVRSEKYDFSNPFILPSSSKEKKDKKKKSSKHKDRKEKPLTKKEKQRLKKVLEKKKKKVDRSTLLEKLQKVQATSDELLQMTSTSFMQTSGRKRHISEDCSNLRIIANNIRGSNKNWDRPPEKKLKLDPNVVGFNDSDSDSDSDSSHDEDDEVEEEPKSDDNDLKLNQLEAENDLTVVKTDVKTSNSAEKNEKTKSEVPEVKCKTKPLIKSKIVVPAVFVPVERTPEIQAVREALPIYSEEHAIMEAIHENPVVVIHGATGTGKTTQLPQFLYEAGFTRNGMKIGITEPRRIAAVQMAARVANEMNLPDAVSYHIRYEKTVDDTKTEIKFMTDGILLKEMQHDFLLSKYSVIIIDEAHERSIFSDVLIGLLSRILPLREKKNCPLKLVIMSATLQVENFTENRRLFKEKPFLITLDSRQYDVVIHFNTKTPDDYIQAALDKICRIHKKLPAGAILSFVTGEKEVLRLCRLLRKAFPFKDQSTHSQNLKTPDKDSEMDTESRKKRARKRKSGEAFSELPTINLDDYSVEPLDNESQQHQNSDDEEEKNDDYLVENQLATNCEPLYVLPLYSHLSTAEQAKVFKPPPVGSRLCVVATNVAETSVTIPGLKYVVDTGKVKTRVYDKVACGISNFAILWTSKASANQRAGRAGRTEGGHCYRLYSSSVFEHEFPSFTTPDIQRIPVDDMLLQMKVLGIDRVVNFPFPTAPDIEALKAAEKRLVMLGAIQDLKKFRRFREMKKWEYSAKITPLGIAMSRFPLSPRYSKMLLLAYKHDIISHTIATVAAMTVPELFISPGLHTTVDDKRKDIVEDQSSSNFKRIGAGQGKALKLGDVMVLIRAVGSYEQSKNKHHFCMKYGLRQKAIIEIEKMRYQLIREMNRSFSELILPADMKLGPPSEEQVEKLRKIVTCCFTDHVAKKIPVEQSKTVEPHLRNAYKCLDLEEPVYIHPSSILAKELPEYVVYQDIFQTTRFYMRNVCEMEPEWLTAFAYDQCDFSEPLETPSPYYDKNTDKIMCSMTSTFGRWNWDLPCVVMPMPSGLVKYNWFAFSLLDGKVCPLFKKYGKDLLSPANVMLKQWGRLLYRTRCLVQALADKEVDSKTALLKAWNSNPKYLLKEYCEWLPDEKHLEVSSKWPPEELKRS